MTREMNKPDWHYKWVAIKIPHEGGTVILVKEERILDDWIKPFFERCCKMERLK